MSCNSGFEDWEPGYNNISNMKDLFYFYNRFLPTFINQISKENVIANG